MEAFVRSVSVWGPGLQGWAASQPVLRGAQDYVASEANPPLPTLLSATERRRTGLVARLALSVAQQASEMAGIAPGAIPSVFATANGDGAVVHSILEALAAGEPVSPTQFHNSVHNTAAGYWSIATGSQQPTNCVACHDSTAAAALLKAVAEVRTDMPAAAALRLRSAVASPVEWQPPDDGVVWRRVRAGARERSTAIWPV